MANLNSVRDEFFARASRSLNEAQENLRRAEVAAQTAAEDFQTLIEKIEVLKKNGWVCLSVRNQSYSDAPQFAVLIAKMGDIIIVREEEWEDLRTDSSGYSPVLYFALGSKGLKHIAEDWYGGKSELEAWENAISLEYRQQYNRY